MKHLFKPLLLSTVFLCGIMMMSVFNEKVDAFSLFDPFGFKEREKQGQKDWEKALSHDNAGAYFNFIVLSSSYERSKDALYDDDVIILAKSKFIVKLRGENIILTFA